MMEHPISFMDGLIPAILADKKIQTRRPLDPQPVHDDGGYFWPSRESYQIGWASEDSAAARANPGYKPEAPTDWFVDHGIVFSPGDRLWVRETSLIWQCGKTGKLVEADGGPVYLDDPDWADVERDALNPSLSADGSWWKKVSPKEMPRWASRITLEVASVRVERLQCITAQEAIYEGVDLPVCLGCLKQMSAEERDRNWCDLCGPKALPNYRKAFAKLWDSIYGDGAWKANPWVAAYEFKRIQP